MTATGLRWLALLTVAARLGSGQSVEVTPFAGVYAPAFELVNESASYFGQITVQHKSTVALGARVGIPLSPRVTLEGVLSYAASGVQVVSTSLGNGDEDASVTVLGAQVAVGSPAVGKSVAFHFTAGLARVIHGGKYWKDFETTVRNAGLRVTGMGRFGLLLGAGLTFKAGSVPVRTGFDAMLYDSEFTFSDNFGSETTQAQLQADLHVYAGVTLSGKRASAR